MQVERQALDGTQLTSGSLTLTVTSSSDLGQFAAGTSPALSWVSSYTVNIAAGSSTSPLFYYRDGVEGAPSVTVAAAGWTSAVQAQTVHPMTLMDDVETGTLLNSDFPPGQWQQLSLPSGGSITATASAAKRGSYGFRVDDTQAIEGSFTEAYLEYLPRALTGNYYIRAWFRMNSWDYTGAGSYIVPIGTYSHVPNHYTLYVHLQFPSRQISVTGFDGTKSGTGSATAAIVTKIELNRWYLMEVAGLGYGTAQGGRRLWLDGKLISAQDGVDFVPAKIDRFRIGEIYSGDRMLTGSWDYDEVRISTVPPPSKITIEPQQEFLPGRCTAVTVGLRDSAQSAPATVPFNVAAALSSSGVPGDYYADPSCAGPTVLGTVIPVNVASTTVYFQPRELGPLTLSASNDDFLTLPKVTATVTGNPLQTTPSSASAAAGSTKAFSATGGSGMNYVWSLLVNNSGATLSAEGSYTAGTRTGVTDSIKVTDAVGNSVSVPIAVIPPPKFLSTPAANTASCSEPFRYSAEGKPSVEGTGTLTFSVRAAEGSLPASLKVDASTGELRWTPARSEAGQYALLLEVTDEGGSATQRIDVSVSCPDDRMQLGCQAAGGGLAAGWGTSLLLAWLLWRPHPARVRLRRGGRSS